MLGTIMLNPNPWGGQDQVMPQVRVLNVTRDEQPRILAEIEAWLQ